MSTGTWLPQFDASVGLQGETCLSYTPSAPLPPLPLLSPPRPPPPSLPPPPPHTSSPPSHPHPTHPHTPASSHHHWPQVVLERHLLERMADICPFVQILDALVPQMGVQLVLFFTSFDTQLPVEQVIDVPKISEDIIQRRLVDRLPQIAEQLVEVPTVVSFASLQQQTVEQIVNLPVPRGREG